VHLDNFLKLIGKNKKLTDLNKGLLEGYKKKLKKEKIRDIATTNNYIKNIKAFLNWLFKREYIPVSVSRFLRRDATIEKDVVALTEEEFCTLEKANFEDKAVQDQIDIFLFGCYTSLSIGDIRKFRPEMINENDILSKRRIKNHSNQKIPLIPEALAILEKHEYNLPFISNNKGTENLKKALRILGLRRKVRISTHRTDGKVIDEWKELCEVISWHKSRKTAITILLSNGVAISLVMQISGHKKESTLSRYKDFSDKVLIEAMKNMRPNKRGAI
jgi:integrase